MKTALGMIAALMMGEAGMADDGALMDPTRPFTAEAEVFTPGVPVLQSTLVSPGRKLAIINGQTLGLGAKLGKAVIADIRPNEVVLWEAGRTVYLRVVPTLKTGKDPTHAVR